MNEDYRIANQAGQALGQMSLHGGIAEQSQSRTIGQNIDARIAWLKAEVVRMERVRSQLDRTVSLLDVWVEDLRQAMNY